MDIGGWAFKNNKLVYFLVAVLIAGGILSAYNMSKLEDPEIKVKQAMVITTYPGASAHQVELEVTDVLEKQIRSMGQIDNIESFSMNDMSLIQVELLSIVPNEETEQMWDLLRRRVADVKSQLPKGASEPMVRDDFGNVFGMFYAITGDGLPEKELTKYAELIKRELSVVDGVERVNIYGRRSECINIKLKSDRMATLGVLPLEVLQTLNGQNDVNYTGYFDAGDHRIRVTVDDRFQSAENIKQMIIQGHTKDQLRLCDIAEVEEDYAEPVRNQLFRDGEEALGILVAATSGTDILKVGDAVEKRLDELRKNRLPVGVDCQKVFYQPERVSASLSTFVINLIESVLIVVVILMFSMGFKSGMIIGISLVITVLGSFLFLSSTGGTMQRVSLAAFILAMGMLVDNAIVIIDGILIDLKMGKPRAEALTNIGKRTGMPLLGATLIAIMAFLPIYLSPDTTGYYVRDLFIVLAVSLLLSWVLALVHVPLMAGAYLHPKVENNGSGEPTYEGKAYAALRKVLFWSLKHRLISIGIMVGLLILSLSGYGKMRHGFFPDMSYDQLYMEYKLPEGYNYTRVKHDLDEISEYLKTRDEITHITMSLGGSAGRYCLVRSVPNPSLAYGELILDFKSPEDLVANIDEIQAEVSKRYPYAYVRLKRYNLMYKKYPIEAQFSGPDPAVLHALADTARAIMAAEPSLRLITDSWEPQIPVITIKFDQEAARALGISRANVSHSVLTAAGGMPVGAFYDGKDKYSINVKCVDADGNPIDDITNAQIFTTLPQLSSIFSDENIVALRSNKIDTDELVEQIMGNTPLRQICKGVDIEWEDPIIPRYNNQRVERVQCTPIPGLETEAARKTVADKIEAIALPDGYELTWIGEKAASSKSMKYLFKNFPLAIILMIAILIMLFKGYRKPAIIFSCLPFIMIGVISTMLITGKTFNFVAIVGTLGLMGMLIKNGIVLMDEITAQLSQGKDPIKALIDSSQSRFRPVLLASLTTILGMIPLIPDDMFGSLAAAIMGGLLVGTVITLVLIPILYALVYKIKVTEK